MSCNVFKMPNNMYTNYTNFYILQMNRPDTPMPKETNEVENQIIYSVPQHDLERAKQIFGQKIEDYQRALKTLQRIERAIPSPFTNRHNCYCCYKRFGIKYTSTLQQTINILHFIIDSKLNKRQAHVRCSCC